MDVRLNQNQLPNANGSRSHDIKSCLPNSKVNWSWPIEGQITTSDTWLDENGINANFGAPICCSKWAGGVCWIRGKVSKLVIIKHNKNLLSAYSIKLWCMRAKWPRPKRRPLGSTSDAASFILLEEW